MNTIIDDDRQRFISVSLQEIVDDLCQTPDWSEEQRKNFRSFCHVFAALYHYKFKKQLDEIKHAYQPFDPDCDVTTKKQYSQQDCQQLRDNLMKHVKSLLNHANYEAISVDEMNLAMTEASPYGINVTVNLDDYADMLLYYRGAATKIEYRRDWRSLFLFKQKIEVPIYKRLFLLLNFKTKVQRVREMMQADPNLSEKQAIQQLKRFYNKELENTDIEKHIFVKLFKNIPRYDLEMLFPNQKIRFKLFDKLKIAITGSGGVIGGTIALLGKMSLIATNPLGFLFAIFGFVAVIVRQVMNVFNHQTKYMMVLSRNLYFHNLDNNSGVFGYLNDLAEDEECKEAVLAYYFLFTQPDQLWTEAELDKTIEQYLHEKYEINVDFEVDDGLRKLTEEQLLTSENGVLKALDLKTACQRLDKQWDEFFSF
ncbi:TMEM143 family protein [Candidatus Albibeggiatoa sp. nov. NOAA]|uniref:TMEM143 family protein n=1 Tax=Candidatus Albibeggiatoa sp. nov. NOAA TaxID=3162724 RepID=UPI0032F3B258|nr:TMEM143 family protein [Thiotrichaceae bacterium]